MDEDEALGLAVQGGLEDVLDVDDGRVAAALGHLPLLDQALGFVDHQDPTFFVLLPLQLGEHESVYGRGCVERFAGQGVFFVHEAAAQFEGGHQGGGFVSFDAADGAEGFEGEVVEFQEAAVGFGEEALAEVEDVFLGGAGAEEDGEELCGAEGGGAVGEELFAGAFGGG